ncbi:hypothetical protein Tco_0373246 [Tanacetum coccineum]
MQDCKPISTLFPTNVKLSSKMSLSSEKERMKMSRVPYASAVRSLMFAMICTRLDIAHAVRVVSRYMAEPAREHWEVVKRIFRYIKVTSDVALCFGESDLNVKRYVDSDYAGDLDGIVAMSTTKAEYVAAAQASKEAGFAAALAVLVTGASQSRQHKSHHRFFPVDTSLIHIESRKSPTKSLIDVGSRRISIFTVNTKEYHSDVLAIITRIMRRT